MSRWGYFVLKMKMNRENDTIVAISTPPGEGGIAVVRISGPDAFVIIKRLFQSQNQKKKKTWESHLAMHGWIMNEEEPVDEVVITPYFSSNSYTGEDVVEISCHGGTYVSRRIVALILNQGARPAHPGEFTQRAFLNGKLDLSQAEAVADLIHAKTEASRRVAVYQLEGHLSERLERIREDLIKIYGLLEIELDFTEEDIAFASRDKLIQQLKTIREEIQRLIQSHERGRVCRNGIRMAIVGRPNVGKSSILNALVEKERAIVTEVPGTTRDIVEDVLDIEGILFTISDTAGMRRSGDLVEQEGIRRTEKALDEADIVLLVCDGSESITDEDRLLFSRVKSLKKKALIVINKSDLKQNINVPQLKIEIEANRYIKTSALKVKGIDTLIQSLQETALLDDIPHEGEVVLTQERHRICLERTESYILKAEEALISGMSQEFVALDLRGATDCLGEIMGKIASDDILNQIFSNFCIGK